MSKHRLPYNQPHLKEVRKELRKNGTSAEATLWKYLKNKQLEGYKFRRQFSIGNFIVDFYCPKAKLAIELDGAPHYTVEGNYNDTERDKQLLESGIRIIRIENKDIFNSTEGVLEQIKHILSHAIN